MDDPLHIIPFLVIALFVAVIALTAVLLHIFEEWLEFRHPALPWFLYAAEIIVFILIYCGDWLFDLDWRTILFAFLGLIASLIPLLLLCFACSLLDNRKNVPGWLKTLALIYVVSFFPALFILIIFADHFG